MTRTEFMSIANQMEPLRRPFVLPYPSTSMLEDIRLLGNDMAAATQATLALDGFLAVRDKVSPLAVPERTGGVLLSGNA